MDEFAWLIALLASPLGRDLSGSVVTLDGALDNWDGAWPREVLLDEEGNVPTEERSGGREEPARRARTRDRSGTLRSVPRAWCNGCTRAFQALSTGSIPVARSGTISTTGSGAVW